MTRFLQIHWLASYPATLLNRDQDGLGKRIPFGGEVRGRISSQCLKRHWRFAGTESHEQAKANPWALQNLGADMGERSKEVVERLIMPAARERQSASDEVGAAVQKALLEDIYGDSAADPKKRQALFFGRAEIGYIADKAAAALAETDPKKAAEKIKGFFKTERQNINALKLGAGLESAMFGRMVTSDPAANRDAAIHVAHALTVHPIAREMDFMSVVDDLKRADESADAGAAGVFDMELTSGLYYGYAVVDVALLKDNLGGDSALAGKLVEHLLHLIAEVTPGAKKGSTAPYAVSEYMLVEAGNRQPRTLANAFRTAVRAKSNRQFLDATEALRDYLSQADANIGAGHERKHMAFDGAAAPPMSERATLDQLAAWAGAKVAA